MTTPENQKSVAIWLFVCCAAIFAMVLLGGVTRLTGSGLSMVKWEPITGILPPLNQTEWKEVFDLYTHSPEYKKLNYHMDVEDFKGIFYFEYAHRVLGRLIGFIFLLPMLFFIFTKRVSKKLTPKLITMFVLGGLQGVLGWYMVKSGLVNQPSVSQYRLTAHLGLAVIIYAYILWVGLSLFFQNAPRLSATVPSGLKRLAAGVSTLAFITILSGGFVAGLRAGFAYNTFPTMNGEWIPTGILNLEPAWRNLFENGITVQFDHRVLATLLFLLIPTLWWIGHRTELPRNLQIGLHLLLAALALQLTLGISTLLLQVPIPLASAHQGGALLLLTASLFVTHRLMRPERD